MNGTEACQDSSAGHERQTTKSTPAEARRVSWGRMKAMGGGRGEERAGETANGEQDESDFGRGHARKVFG